jgi:hypothetical protein
MSKQKFTEILFRRIEARDGENDQRITVSFERLRIIKQVSCTEAQAEILNAGKLANQEFTLLLKEGEADPQPQFLTVQKADKADRTDVKFYGKTRLGDMLPK